MPSRGQPSPVVDIEIFRVNPGILKPSAVIGVLPVTAIRTRRLDGEYPYLMLDATFERVCSSSSRPSLLISPRGPIYTHLTRRDL